MKWIATLIVLLASISTLAAQASEITGSEGWEITARLYAEAIEGG